ncbi:MAG: BNR-4 repeat-containing protein [Anditalea sp.]
MNKVKPINSFFAVVFFASMVFYSCQTQKIVQLDDNSGWCWYQDERAVIDGDQVIFSGVTSDSVNTVSSYNLKTGEQQTSVLNDYSFPLDDHNVGALLVRPDGRYLSVYAGHGIDQMMRYRISTNPGDISQWEMEKTVDVGGKVTYSNVYRLAKTGTTYNYHRGIGRNPNYMISDNNGNTWTYGGQLFAFEGRPYLKYASDNVKRIHFITTEEHPRHYNNSIYHGYIQDGFVYQSDGYQIGHVSTDTVSSLSPQSFTMVFDGNKETRADVAWTSDIELDGDGHPYIAFSVAKDPIALGETIHTENGGFDHRYHYARWDGDQWNEYEIAYAGTRLYAGENEYTGLVTLHPNDPNVVYISANVHPKTGKPLKTNGSQRYEIFRGTTKDQGATWKWKAITKNSGQDNIRPIVLDHQQKEVVLWLKGRYTTYRDYDLKVMGLVPR